MNSEKGISTLMLVGIMAIVLMAFGVTLFATKPPTSVNSHATENITNVQIPTLRPHTSAAPKASEAAEMRTSLTPGNGDDLDTASNDLDNENLDETASDTADINAQAASF